MPTISGKILNRHEVLTEYGNKEKFDNNYKRGTRVWLHYDSKNKLVTAEIKKDGE